MKTVPKMLMRGLAEPVVLGTALFLTAGTLNYWQAWVFLAVAVLCTAIPTVYLLVTDPATVERRLRSGPTAEARPAQKILILGWYSSLAGAFLLSALDRRFGWSQIPTGIWLIGIALVAVGLGVTMLVVIQNSHAAATVRVEADQTVTSTGLYGLVRHPMYTANVILTVGIPLALGSYWGLIFVVPGLIVLAMRIRDEEKLLQQQLAGYCEYTQKVRFRLVPCVW